jgi:hypothetical protein
MVERTYYDLIESLYFQGLNPQADEKLAEFTDRFPNCDYIQSIKRSKKMYDAYRNPVPSNPSMTSRTIKL